MLLRLTQDVMAIGGGHISHGAQGCLPCSWRPHAATASPPGKPLSTACVLLSRHQCRHAALHLKAMKDGLLVCNLEAVS